jgi:hypothetical protein
MLIDEVIEALEPFAKLLERKESSGVPHFGSWNHDDERHMVGVSTGEMRRAAALLTKLRAAKAQAQPDEGEALKMLKRLLKTVHEVRGGWENDATLVMALKDSEAMLRARGAWYDADLIRQSRRYEDE